MGEKSVDYNNLTDEQKEYLKNYKASDAFFFEKSYYIGAGCLYNFDVILAVSILMDMITNAKDTRKIDNFELWLKTVLDLVEKEVEDGTVMEDDAAVFTTFLTELTEHMGRCIGLAGIHTIDSPQVQYELSDILRQLCERYNLTDNYSLLLGKPVPALFNKLKGTPYGLSYFGKVFASFAEHVVEFKNEPKVVYKTNLEKLICTKILGVTESNIIQHDAFKALLKTVMESPLSKTERTVVYVADNTIYNELIKHVETIVTNSKELSERPVQNVVIRVMTSAYGEPQAIVWDALDLEGFTKLKAEIDELSAAHGAPTDEELSKAPTK